MRLEDADQLLLPGHDEDVLDQVSDSQIRLHLVDRLEGVTPAMIEWWFGHMERDTYMKWHPHDHQEFAWVKGWEPGRYVGATHMTRQTLGGGGAPMRADITFAPRALWFDWKLFEPNDVGAVVCAIVHPHDEHGQPRKEESARFVHIAIERDYGTEMRSSFWLNITPDVDVDRVTKGRTKHVHEECGYLAGFLPELYAERSA
jgi:hypothetical protein